MCQVSADLFLSFYCHVFTCNDKAVRSVNKVHLNVIFDLRFMQEVIIEFFKTSVGCSNRFRETLHIYESHEWRRGKVGNLEYMRFVGSF